MSSITLHLTFQRRTGIADDDIRFSLKNVQPESFYQVRMTDGQWGAFQLPGLTLCCSKSQKIEIIGIKNTALIPQCISKN